MSFGKLLSSLLACQLMAGSAAHATAQRTVDGADITVTGKSLPEVRQEVTQYVTEVGIAVGETPAARWVDDVCPHAIGLQPEVAARVEAQVRAIAEQAGAPLAKAKCRANLLIVFTDDAPGLVRKIAKRQPLGDLNYEDRKALEAGAMPVRWWYSHEFRGEDGLPATTLISPAFQLSGVADVGGINNSFLASRKATNSKGASVVASSSIRAIRHATIIVDVNKAEGKALSSVIDLAAVVGLAEIRPDASPPNSILNLFGTSDVRRLSGNDVALLKSLYTMPLLRKADQHRRSLVTNMLKYRYDPKQDSAN